MARTGDGQAVEHRRLGRWAASSGVYATSGATLETAGEVAAACGVNMDEADARIDDMSVSGAPKLTGGLVAELRRQADRCRPSAPLYGELLEHLAEDAAFGGVTLTLLAPYARNPMASVPGLRLLAAMHRLVLQGRIRELAPYYPSVGGTEPPEQAWPVFRAALTRHSAEIAALLAEPVQTNEPGRAAVLYGGLLVIAHRTGLPVRLLEIGASAGLNLCVDRYCYLVEGVRLGDPLSPVVLDEPWIGAAPAPIGTPVQIVSRRGCDLAPIDPSSSRGRLRLHALVWPDPTRVARLRGALDVAGQARVEVDRASADEWLADRLATPVPGAVTLVWHSVVRQYVERRAWRRIGDVIDAAGSAATSDAPLAHLALEPEVAADGRYTFEARLTSWPPGYCETLATAGGHGPPVRWKMEE